MAVLQPCAASIPASVLCRPLSSPVQVLCCLSQSSPSAPMSSLPSDGPQPKSAATQPLQSSSPARTPSSPPDSSPPTACCTQTSSGSSNTSLAAPCSPISPSTSDTLPPLPRIRRIHIDFDYRKPTPNLNPVEPTPEELLAKDFRFLTHEPRQPLST
ncbi:hypothetical protein CROQUDRAFT_372558 [Cronartium quercuum f. sp. fusiforme G11]|uniref:Uncharacterized protein n=1 Tax=Cronartium quercuum f. sp. fusiforme G11 TaxID=708437 RepID=A0A9P6TDZ1_9BASI|nr:hypothetical protein CROQUDRAFT_372558 [Cronartium quercuum f. sp. fusiforme G11]